MTMLKRQEGERKTKKTNKHNKIENYTPASQIFSSAPIMMMSMATMNSMGRARSKAIDKVTATTATVTTTEKATAAMTASATWMVNETIYETVTETTTVAPTARVTATSIGTATVTSNAMSRMMTTAAAIIWFVTLWIRMLKMLLQLRVRITMMQLTSIQITLPPKKKSRQTDKQRNELANTPKKDKEQEQPFFFFLYNKLIFIKINCLNYFFVILIESLSLLILLMENS